MGTARERWSIPLLCALAVVALTMGGLFLGYEPVSGDPDCLYRPIKGELAEALRHGTLPFWSDLFGLGVPLVAESHAAAFYPLNWFSYRVFDVSVAYRLGMWLHYLGLVLATYGYARVLGLTAWGSALSAMALSLCGFQMSHACHEPFYHLLPYLPLSLMLAEKFMAEGKVVYIALLAVALGAQITLGHFQIQAWTAGLIVLTGLWRAASAGRPWRRAGGLILAVGWAGAVASVQLLLTWDLTRASNFDRPIQFLTLYSFPPAHLAQVALPSLFMGFVDGTRSHYWESQRTTADEACLYVGTVPLILACCGLFARRDRALALWRCLAVVGVVLSTMDYWWPEGFELLLRLPVIGHFRAPGRYTLLTSVGLCLLAGRGFDGAMSARRFWAGFALAVIVGIAALGWGWYWSSWPDVRLALGDERAARFLGAGGVVWGLSLLAVALWRVGKLPPWGPFLLAACELAYLYHHGTTPWGRAIRFPEESPVFRVLKAEANVGLITGDLQDLPVRAGLTAAYPNLGIVAPPPNYLLEQSRTPTSDLMAIVRSRRFGVTHGIFEGSQPSRPCEVIYVGPDPTLDALLPYRANTRFPRLWRVERYSQVFPAARCARKVSQEKDWYGMFPTISFLGDPDEVIFLKQDRPPDPPGPRASTARVLHWDGRSGEFEHDGTFDLVLRRTFVPGWTASLNGGQEIPVIPVEGGLQSIRIPGSGVTRVTVRYRPVWLGRGLAISLSAVALAGFVIAIATVRTARRR